MSFNWEEKPKGVFYDIGDAVSGLFNIAGWFGAVVSAIYVLVKLVKWAWYF